ncbi:hypothetical protein C1646_720152 [Rhizophagus diaphanus]|nr:hypothetical protein C1646_720152 [Rhizophagus diaphanus] [Rhizophagus sp. MUCL 43196]
MLLLTGSDVHFPSTGAYAWTVFNVPNITYEGIMIELRAIGEENKFLFHMAHLMIGMSIIK